ncbi:MAG: ribulose phosphate epimerase, partial [Thaumarchaeota archaeon]|nr:ribulose phosphate epimerase [Nitrososphaerota archaeon]
AGQACIEATHGKARSVRDAVARAGFGGDTGADGGVNASNAGACFDDGARVLVGGGAIMARDDARAAVAEISAAVRHARRAAIIARARGLGGDELVSSWIALHEDAGTRAELEAIASGEGRP